MNRIELGDRVKVKVVGLEGIAVAISQHLWGCDRIGVQSTGVDKDGKPQDTYWFDEMAVDLVSRKEVIGDERPQKEKTGGPSLPGQTPTRFNPK